MAQEVTLGGDRVGSGNKQKVELHNYGMNSFNLEQDWKSSMAPGILYPFLKLVGTNHGTFDIDLDSFIRTLPTKGPLFGSYKLQLDLYNVPIRLYQGILHNNPVGIGLKMNQVYLPKLQFQTVDYKNAPRVEGSTDYDYQVNSSSLMKYLGISGAGRKTNRTTSGNVTRKFNAVPFLAYYDIFKCYYSNKQEENAYVITPGTPENKGSIPSKFSYRNNTGGEDGQTWSNPEQLFINYANIWEGFGYFEIKGKNLDPNKIYVFGDPDYTLKALKESDPKGTIRMSNLTVSEDKTKISGVADWFEIYKYIFGEEVSQNTQLELNADYESIYYNASIALTPFKLANIDDMRNALLSSNVLGSEFVLGSDWDDGSGTDQTGLPYSALFKTTEQGITWNAFINNGLVVKTYQSDLFNNWLDTEFIDGENGISAISAVDTSAGSFTMDTLNLAEKIYDLLNRVLVSGGTYEDWQEAVYGEGAVRKAETPMYIGGMAAEVMFEEVISNSETKLGDDFMPLGSLGGKGTQVGKRGGNNIHVKCDEPSYIIGIASLTPRICYSQGNDWDMTDLDTLDDLHKPALDGIGFQDLMVEQFAWWDTEFIQQQGGRMSRNAAGKQTAWINYQTAVDKCFGDFAKQDGVAFMVLNRNYEMDINAVTDKATVKDITTYIDPAKFNYAFAVDDLAAQNFWVQIHSKVVARRKMGAQQLPNL